MIHIYLLVLREMPSGRQKEGESHTLSCFNSIRQQGFQMCTSVPGLALSTQENGSEAGTRPEEGASLQEGGVIRWVVLLKGGQTSAGSGKVEVMGTLTKGFRGAAST